MLYKHLKSLILIIPTLTIGLWEYVRHTFLLPYITMELGNWLAPLLVFFVTMTLLRKLFTLMEELQEELQQERAAKAALEERERIAKELHDGIAQSLFLLSVRVDRLETGASSSGVTESLTNAYQSLRKTVHEVNEYVRQAIASLRYPANPQTQPWMESITHMIDDFKHDTGISVHVNWKLTEQRLSLKEKVELYSTIREALINVYKHAEAMNIWIIGKDEGPQDWHCSIQDDGRGFHQDSMPTQYSDGYGLMIIQDRADKLDWNFTVDRKNERTILDIRKEISL